jgi:hypothetical protein
VLLRIKIPEKQLERSSGRTLAALSVAPKQTSFITTTRTKIRVATMMAQKRREKETRETPRYGYGRRRYFACL